MHEWSVFDDGLQNSMEKLIVVRVGKIHIEFGFQLRAESNLVERGE